MDMLRCPACDGVLEPFQRDQEEVLGCKSCGRCFSPDYLEELEGWYEQGAGVLPQPQRIASIEPPNIAHRVYAATNPKRRESQKLRGLFLQGWASSVGFFTLIGLLQVANTQDWRTLLALIGVGAVIGVGCGLIWLRFFLHSDHNPFYEDMTAGEAIEQLRQHNRAVLERKPDEPGDPSTPQETLTPQLSSNEILDVEQMKLPIEKEERASPLAVPDRVNRTPFTVKCKKDPETKVMNRAFLYGWIGTMFLAAVLAAGELERRGGGLGVAITGFFMGSLVGVVVGGLLVILAGGLTSRSHASDEATEGEVAAGQGKGDSFDASQTATPSHAVPGPSEQDSEAVQKPPTEIQR